MTVTRRTVLAWLLAAVIAPALPWRDVNHENNDAAPLWVAIDGGDDNASGMSPNDPLASVAEALKRSTGRRGDVVIVCGPTGGAE